MTAQRRYCLAATLELHRDPYWAGVIPVAGKRLGGTVVLRHLQGSGSVTLKWPLWLDLAGNPVDWVSAHAGITLVASGRAVAGRWPGSGLMV
jgi:hypothetical protein